MERGQRSAVLFWPGSAGKSAANARRKWRPFDKTMSVDARVRQVLDWLDLPAAKRPRLIAAYFDQVDVAGHRCGAHCADEIAAERAVDAGLAELRAGIARVPRTPHRPRRRLRPRHGRRGERPHPLPRRHRPRRFDRIGGRRPGHCWSRRAGHERACGCSAATTIDAYGANAAAGWHYGTNRAFPAIVCQADEGWLLEAFDKPFTSR